MKFVALVLTFCAQVIAEHLTIGNDAVCNVDHAPRDLGLRLVRRQLFVYICEAPLNSSPDPCVTQGNHCQLLSCSMQGYPVGPHIGTHEKKDKENTLPRAHILVATILALGFIVSAIGLFIWVRTTRRANVCWAKTHAHTSPAHSELSISDDNHLDDKDYLNDGANKERSSVSADQPVTRAVSTRVEMREHVHSSHISRDLRKESIAEVEEER